VTDGNGNPVVTTPASPQADSTGHYTFTILSTNLMPVTVAITNGTDTITALAQGFTLTGANAAPLSGTGTVTLNANPISTLIVESARAAGGLTAANLSAATTHVLNTLGFGLPSGFNPMTTPVTPGNVAAVIKANAAAAELIRRVKVSTGKTMAQTITAIAEDITDGVINGAVATGITATQATAKTAGVILIKQAQIAAELFTSQLKITDQNGVTKVTAANSTAKLNAAILKAQPTATGANADISQVPVTQAAIDQAKNAIALANILTGGSDPSLNNLSAAINTLKTGTVPGNTQIADVLTALTNASTSLGTANTNANAGTNTTAVTTATTTINSAPTFTGTPTFSGIPSLGNTLSITGTATTDADGDTVTLSYQWNSNGAVIAGATAATYIVQAADQGKKITAVITANDGKNAANSATLAVTSSMNISTAPLQTFSAIAFSSDTGLSSTDFITKTPVQTITATLSAVLSVSDKVLGSLNGGATWTDITAKVVNTTLTWNGATLTASNTLKLKVQDGAGNNGAIASQVYVLDTVVPTVSITSNASVLKIGSTATLTFTLSKISTNFVAADIAVAGGTLSGFAATSGTIYTATFTPTTNSTTGAMVDVLGATFTDAVGNNNSAATQFTMTVDTVAPTLTSFTSTTLDGSYKAGATINITATYSEVPSPGSTLTVSLNSGKTGLVLNAISGTTIIGAYTVLAGNNSAGLSVSSITNQIVHDAAGNALTTTTAVPSINIATGSVIVVDSVVPTVAISSNATALKAGSTATLTFTLSEVIDLRI